MLKTLSIIGYIGMIGGLLGLLTTRTLFSSSPVAISVQVLAFVLFLWARITFGRRSYHVVADQRRLGDWRTVSVHPASDLRGVLPVYFGWSSGAHDRKPLSRVA